MHPLDPLEREELIRNYLLRRLDQAAADAFEGHYLACDECFEEMRATQLLMAGLGTGRLEHQRLDDVLLLQFKTAVHLTRNSRPLNELLQGVLEQKDTKVLIDLSRVSRIDSAGLGMLMNCYSHAVRNQGALKLLNPTAEVKKLLELTRMDSVVEMFFDVGKALESFHS